MHSDLAGTLRATTGIPEGRKGAEERKRKRSASLSRATHLYPALAQALLQAAMRILKQDDEMRSIVLSDPEARNKARDIFSTGR